jgi:hypothetical protein
MAERNFEEKAEELREARDIYREVEVEGGGSGAIGIVPGAPGVRRTGGRRVEDEMREQSNVLRGLREEVQELRRVVSVLRGGLVEASEGFKEFNKGFSQLSREVQEFHRGFGQVVKEFREFQVEFSQVSRKLREEVGKLLELLSGLGKLSGRGLVGGLGGLSRTLSEVSYELGREYERVVKDVSEEWKILREARKRLRERKEEGGRGGYGYGVGSKGRWLGYGRGYGFWDTLAKEEIEKQLSVREQLKGYVKRSVIGLIFGDVGGGGRYGRYGRGGVGELVGDIRSVWLAAMGPIGVFVGEWLSGLYEKWQERKELKKQLEEQKKAELAALGIRKVREIKREKGGMVSELWDWVKEVLWGRKLGGGGVILSAVGGGVGQGRVGFGGVWGLLGGGGVDLGKVGLSDVELVQERGAKIYADKLHIEAKQVSGVGGGMLDVLSGGGLFGRLGRVGRWIGRRAGWIGLGLGAGLAFLGGIREGGLVAGVVRGGGALLGGLGGAKLGALIGTVIVPGIGTAIGSVLGGALGMFGGEKIADAVYEGMRRLIKDRDWVESLRSGFMGALDRIGSFLKGVVEGVKSGISAIGSGVRELGGKVLDVMKWVGEALGVVAREAEAGTIDMVKAAGVVGHTRGDPGGMSVGMYQFTRETALRFLREYGYMKEFEGLEFGAPEWRRRWQEVAKRYGEAFAKAQQEFAVKEYFVPGVRQAERFGIDVSKSRALQEMVFARTIQHGVGGFGRVLRNVFGGMTPEQVKVLSPEEVITRVYDHLIANVDKYWASSSPRVREVVRKRLMKEKELLLAIERQKVEVKKQEGLQKRVTQVVSDLQGSVKEQVDLYKSTGKELKGVSEGVKELKENMQGVVKDIKGLYQDMSPEELEELARKYEAEAMEIERSRSSLGRLNFGWSLRDPVEFEKLSKQLKEMSDQAEELQRKAQELREIAKQKREQALGRETYLSYEPGEKIYALSGVVKDEVVTEGGVVDDVLVVDQREVTRRVIEEGVRASVEWMGNIVRVIEGLKGGEGVGGAQKVIMLGGDAFSKVPLFPEDMGLVMMMLGLV